MLSLSRKFESMVRSSKAYKDLETRVIKATARAEIAEREAAAVQKDNDDLAERVAAISDRLCKVSVQSTMQAADAKSTPRRRLRLCVEIDPEVIEQGFLHGNDATVIEYIGRRIGAQATVAIQRANFQRWEI